jgi:hypothetical protein
MRGAPGASPKLHKTAGVYWQENIIMEPAPPGTAPAADEPDVSVMTVPAATLLPAVAVQLDPLVAVVAQLMIELTAVHGFVVAGVTLNTVQVVAAPVYEKMVMLGLQAAGAITAVVA